MLMEALKFLQDQARKSAAPQLIETNPDAITYVIDGKVETFVREPGARKHEPACLGALIDLATRFAKSGFSPVVWYDSDAVVLVIDDGGHRTSTARFCLEESDLFKVVRGLRENRMTWFNQKQFIRLLRVDLANTLPEGTLLNLVRKIRFENGVSVTGDVQRSRESMGRELKSTVETSAGEIPERVLLEVPVYKTPGEDHTFSLCCAVEIDPQQGAFQLVPLPDEIERVQNLAVNSIAERLNEQLPETVPAWHGKP